MKHNKEEQLNIGKRIYQREISVPAAAIQYDVDYYTARTYLRLYKAFINASNIDYNPDFSVDKASKNMPASSQYDKMTREELIEEIFKLKKTISEI